MAIKNVFQRGLRGLERSPRLMVGNDICHIPRIARIMGDSPEKAARFVRRVLTEEEISHPGLRRCIVDLLNTSPLPSSSPLKTGIGSGEDGKPGGKSNGKPTGASDPDAWKKDSRAAAVFMAGRWAAKEAIIKAHPFRRLTFHDIMIYSSTFNLDYLEKRERKKEKRDERKRDEMKRDERRKEKREEKKRAASMAIRNTAPSTEDTSEPENPSQPDTVSQTTTKANSAEVQKPTVGEDEPLDDKSGYIDRNNGSGMPVAIVRGLRGTEQADERVSVSISHDGDYASAVCIATMDIHPRTLSVPD
ncbi:hypothetical protein QBC37DRAFT_368771 [Rhypophila decipiens]|uniref:4'-phosphopantetheinyl transferase domain-containing protein n=1 Tax=Rhypophila decipiens TaxID=261697 RepID=A0AAN7BEU4_9PEZI|nr:hypothetical protein QBC37DRAFT_368771 [Rhypophila decipiens]